MPSVESIPEPPAWLDIAARTALDAAADGRDGPDEALALLIDAVALHPAPQDAGPLDVDALRDDPTAWRGAPVAFAGVVQQVRALDAPFASVHECFLRDAGGRPFVVFVRVAAGAPVPAPGRRLAGAALAYRRLDAVARDGAVHRYPALVADGAWCATPAASPWRMPPGAALLGGLVVLVPALLVAHRMARRARRSGPSARPSRRADAACADAATDDRPLPADPAAALDELRDRA